MLVFRQLSPVGLLESIIMIHRMRSIQSTELRPAECRPSAFHRITRDVTECAHLKDYNIWSAGPVCIKLSAIYVERIRDDDH
jgi:hypothetical protein